MASSELTLSAKLDVVIVEKTSRGKFPGSKASKGSIGLVWSTWVSNSNYSTKKLSILDTHGEVTFTTYSCVTKVGTMDSFPELQSVYDNHVEKYFVPVFCTLEERFSLTSPDMSKSIKISYLGKPRTYYVKKHCISLHDLRYMYENQKEKVFSLRVEPWVLKKHGII